MKPETLIQVAFVIGGWLTWEKIQIPDDLPVVSEEPGGIAYNTVDVTLNILDERVECVVRNIQDDPDEIIPFIGQMLAKAVQVIDRRPDDVIFVGTYNREKHLVEILIKRRKND